MKTLPTAALAAALMATATTPLLAQTYGGQTYGNAQVQAQAQNQQYQRNQTDYDRQYEEYQRSRAQYDRDRAEYDRRYGSGAYDRYYSSRTQAPAPVYDNRPNETRYDPYDSYRNSPCERQRSTSSNRTAGTIIGALVGGAIGVGVANDHDEGKGAVLGAIVGGALGNQIGANAQAGGRHTAQCDSVGYYWTYEQTQPYQEDARYRNARSGRYDNRYYARQRCRLAVAPAEYGGRTDYRYVRVCPDRNNRYRITG